MPKKIFYCVDFHCPAGGALGYDGGAGGRLGGRRRPGGYLRESESPVSNILAAFKELPEGLKKDVEQIATSPDGVMTVKHKDGKFTVVEDGKPIMERVSADEVKKSGKLGKKQVTVMTKDELSKMLSECDDADPEQMMKEFVEKKRKCGVEEDEYRRPKNQPHNLHQVDEGEDIEEDEDVEEDEYRRPKNQPHNLHRVDEKNAPAEYHNDFGSDLLACAKGMNDHDFNSAHVGVWSGFGFHAVVPVGFSGSHVTLEPSDDNMLTLPQFLNGLKKIGIKKLSDVKTLDIYGEDSEYAGFEWDRNSLMKVICLKFSSKKGDQDPKDMLRDFMSEEDSKNEFEGESEELNESMVRFCDRLIRG